MNTTKSIANQPSPFVQAQVAAKPPPAAMLDLIIGYWMSQMIFVAAKLGLADHMQDGPITADALSERTKTHAPSLFRLMRALASAGVFVERADGKFELTPLGATLRSNVPGSMHGFALMMIEKYNWDSWRNLQYSIETGGVALEKTLGMKVFEYLDRHPEDARIFGESMSNLSAAEHPAVVQAYDFSRFKKIIDVGGGHGSLLCAILAANPKLHGVLYDNPRVVADAKKASHVTRKEVAGRVEIVGGDFFERVPSGGDAYIMKYILHDWDDERALKLLRNCRAALGEKGTLLAVDTVIPPGNDPHWGKLLDVNMLVATGGMERTEQQFRELYARAGFELTRVVSTSCPLSIVEGRPK
jgi:hypothetical protein